MTVPPNKMSPLSPELRDLIKDAQFEEGPDEQTRDRLFHRLAGTLALPLLPQAATGTGALASKTAAALFSGKSIAIVAALSAGIGLLGAGGWYVFHNHRETTDTSSTEETRSPPPAKPVAAAAVAVDTETEHLEKTDAGSNRTRAASADTTTTEVTEVNDGNPKTPRHPADKDATAAERLLIESAREALRKGYAKESLTMLRQHKKRFPKGRFKEERDALQIMAAARSGSTEEARKLALRFVAQYPQSMFIDAVNAAVEDRK